MATNHNKRICRRCLRKKDISEFPSILSHGKRVTDSRCRPCTAAYQAQWKAKLSAEKLREYKEARCDTSSRRSYLRAKYGIDTRDFADLLKKQGGLCAICRKPETRLAEAGKHKQKRYSMCVDHCHKTGKIRGLLCCRCNRTIGGMNDDPALLRAAANYLEAHHLSHPPS